MLDPGPLAGDQPFQLTIIPVGRYRRRDPKSVEIPSHTDLPLRKGGSDRRCRFEALNGNQYCLADLARLFNLKPATLRSRLLRGWSLARALTDRPQRNPLQKLVWFQGEAYDMRSWAARLDLSESGLRARLKRATDLFALVEPAHPRRGRTISFNGDTLTIAQWAEIRDMRVSTLRKRLARRWPVSRALTEPCHEEKANPRR